MPFHPPEMTQETLRRLVDNLVKFVKAHPLPASPKRSQLQEALAATLGWPNYHAAITQLKRAEPLANKAPPGPSAEWLLSTDLINDASLPFAWTKYSTSIDNEEYHLIPADEFAASVLLKASEKVRRRVITEVIDKNPGKAICQVKGPMSILPSLKNATVIKHGCAQTLLDTGSAVQIIDMMVGLLAPTSGDNAMWKNRAISLLSCVVVALVHLRDAAPSKLPGRLDPHTIRQHLSLDHIHALANRQELPPMMAQSLTAYLRSLPGYDNNKTIKDQPMVVAEQHGYLVMQLTHMLELITGGSVEVLQHDQSSQINVSIELSDKPLTHLELELVKSSIQSWLDKHPGGLLVFDVPPLDSLVWPWIVNRLPHWLDQGVAVWIGVVSKGDVPSSAFKALYPRMMYGDIAALSSRTD